MSLRQTGISRNYSCVNQTRLLLTFPRTAQTEGWKPIEELILVSPALADTATKLSAIYRGIAETEKERATDLLDAADFCEELTRQMVITSSHIDSPGTILNAKCVSNIVILSWKPIEELILILSCDCFRSFVTLSKCPAIKSRIFIDGRESHL